MIDRSIGGAIDSSLDRMLHSIDPVIAGILNRAIDGKDIEVEEACELFECSGRDEVDAMVMVADMLRRTRVGDHVTYVVNRNINFTNVCIKRCGFCAFSRDFREDEGYLLPVEEIVRRAEEAYRLGATEVCIQAGLMPKMDGMLYIDICRAIKRAIPDMHIHAFSPEEIKYGALRAGMSVEEYLKALKDAGLGSIPGTAAEILVQEVRDTISPGRIKVRDWVSIVKMAHRLGIPSTSTIMYGHVESSMHKAMHLALIRDIQRETHGFTEFVPLSFVYREAPMYRYGLVKGVRAGPSRDEVLKMHSIARIMLNNHIPNIQVSWVKEGLDMCRVLLNAGANDMGGTLINESISTAAGAMNGQMLRPREIRALIRGIGRVPVQRDTLYRRLRVFDGKEEHHQDPLDTVEDTSIFGSYHELIRLDRFKYKRSHPYS
ncbi:MAG: 5-amino-6-(D-ribitylamino)uracil--L-tyrosine 4-hydroxyphenyl transferase CofH [Candidatus Nitrosocaldus sp.]|nr:5-amino-6-(D-ribitylamino)uracil--L-tyrosine 4-hydroxyphenyl transferase CofH [Candidatus Nitrosocaldus sp.]MDW8000979.1 5-amino-6-(D-ribitylamino)uracil--L-tyrosine 4-hydroxyphenyl transferase CofH [Candidatus Nitrosocaldus sp.]